jgi:hypothetical protein
MMTINIFDFDKTLFNTPDNSDMNKGIYFKKTGKIYPYIGWFSKKETLDETIFDITLNKDISILVKESIDANCLTILLTGRIVKLRNDVKRLCVKHDLLFDRYYCSDKNNTLDFKISVLRNLYNEHPDVTIHFYDDRIEHRDEFVRVGASLWQNKFIYHFVL